MKCDCGHDQIEDHGVTLDNKIVRCKVKGCTCTSPGLTMKADRIMGELTKKKSHIGVGSN